MAQNCTATYLGNIRLSVGFPGTSLPDCGTSGNPVIFPGRPQLDSHFFPGLKVLYEFWQILPSPSECRIVQKDTSLKSNSWTRAFIKSGKKDRLFNMLKETSPFTFQTPENISELNHGALLRGREVLVNVISSHDLLFHRLFPQSLLCW
jgi:hypothetical protein